MAESHAAWAFGKVAKGFEVLVVGDGSLRDRLAGAWHAGLCFATPEMMPTPELKSSMTQLHDFFLQPPRDHVGALIWETHGAGWAAVRRKRYSTLRPMADRIWDLYDRLNRET